MRGTKLKYPVALMCFVTALIAGGVSGYVLTQNDEPYRLDYHKANIDILVTYRERMALPTLGLGEKYLADDMAQEFMKYGVNAEVHTLEDTYAHNQPEAGYEIYLRNYPELSEEKYFKLLDKDKIKVLFETIPYKFSEVKNADIVFTGSLKKHKEYLKNGLRAYFLPQFTRLDKFYYAPKPEYKSKVLYIANQWPDMEIRKSMRYALETGIELDVYGNGWERALDENTHFWWKKEQVPNEELKYYYSSADIVLNDTRDDMVEAGFISNRIFDVTACKGFLISDYIPEIEEFYGDSIPMYKNKEEFKALIEYYLAHPEERLKKAERAYKITREKFGADKVIKEMLDKMEAYRRKCGFKSAGE